VKRTALHPNRRRFLNLGAVLLSTALIAAACSGSSDSDTIKLGSEPLSPSVEDIQQEAPDGLATNVGFSTFDGGVGSLSSYAGTPLVVNFFAAWCPNCISEMPDFEVVHQELGDSVSIVGLSIDAAVGDALDLIRATGITYDTGWDPRTDAFNVFGGFAMPTTVFIDSSGSIAEVFSGALNADSLRKKIEQIT